MKNKIAAIVRQAIDIHVHVGPEIIPRRYTAKSLASEQSGKIRGAVLKNHFYPTIALVEESLNFEEYGSIVLNLPVGGLNTEAIRAATLIAKKPFFVWLPTIHAANFLANSDYEIAPEWCSGQLVNSRKADQVNGLYLLDNNGCLSLVAQAVVKSIAKADAILATGHVSALETAEVVKYALRIGVKRIVITHPIYQRINMSLGQQCKLANDGCFIEICYSMYSLDKIPISVIAQQIRKIGPKQVILSSDVGQAKSESPSEALLNFCRLLIEQKIPVEWLQTMLVDNPYRLLGITQKI